MINYSNIAYISLNQLYFACLNTNLGPKEFFALVKRLFIKVESTIQFISFSNGKISFIF